MTDKELWLPEREPEVIIEDLLASEWAYGGDGRFELDDAGEPKWLHTGQYDQNNPNPQITVTPGSENPRGDRGWSGIDPSGAGPVTWVDGTVDVEVWVPSDEYPYETTGINPKSLVAQLMRECERIVGENYEGTFYNGQPELQFLGTGSPTPVPPQDGSPVDHRRQLPVFYTWHKNRVKTDDS